MRSLFDINGEDSFRGFTRLLLTRDNNVFRTTGFTVPYRIAEPAVTGCLRILRRAFIIRIVEPCSARQAARVIVTPGICNFSANFVYCMGKHGRLHTRSVNFV